MGVISDIDKLSEVVQKLKEMNDNINTFDIPRTNFSGILEDENLLAVYYKDWALITELRKLEIEELNKCEEDVNRWATYMVRNHEQINRINFFIDRLRLYIRGGVADGVQYLGLYSYFRDVELVRELLKSDVIKKLRLYNKQVKFFQEADEVIRQALKNPGWEGFLGKNGFYYNLRHGKKYIRMVRGVFENREFAELLERLHERIHEEPGVWEKEMEELSRKLNEDKYQNESVIVPVAQILLILFHKAREKLFRGEDIGKRKEKLRGDIARLKKDFDKIDNPVADEMSKIMPVLIDLMTKVGVLPQRRLNNLSRTLDVYSSWLGRYKALAQRLFVKPVVPIGAAFFAAVQSDNLAVKKAQLVNTPLINQTNESYVYRLESRINTLLIPELQKVVNFIRENDEKFTRPISDTKELLPEVQESFLRLQNNIAAEFKKAGIDLTKPMYG